MRSAEVEVPRFIPSHGSAAITMKLRT